MTTLTVNLIIIIIHNRQYCENHCALIKSHILHLKKQTKSYHINMNRQQSYSHRVKDT